MSQGIYKITSPSDKVYIGQSINIEKRFSRYEKLDCESQTILYRSLKKYGPKNHTFEIIELCTDNQLNKRERYYQDIYNVIESNGLNCQLTTTASKSGKHSEETKKKMSISQTGRKHTEESKRKMRIACIGRRPSKEAVENSRIARIGKSYSFGLIRSEETKKKISIAKSKKVICIMGSKFFTNAREAAISLGMSRSALMRRLNGRIKNNTSMRYV